MHPFRTLAFASILAILPASGTGGWVEIPGIKGESTDRAHEGWIDIESVSYGAERAEAAPGAASGAESRGAVSHGAGQVTIVKRADKSSVILAQAVANGKHFPTVTIDSRKEHMVLTSVLISSVQHESNSGAGERPNESVTFKYGGMTISYPSNPDDRGAAGTAMPPSTIAAPAAMSPRDPASPAAGAVAAVPPLPPRALALEGQLLPAVSPAARAWVISEAGSLHARGLAPSSMTAVARQDAGTRFAQAHLSPRDIDTLVFLVLMEGAKVGGQEMQMKLQMEMDRRSQLEAAISNIMKTMNDTASDLLRNIK